MRAFFIWQLSECAGAPPILKCSKLLKELNAIHNHILFTIKNKMGYMLLLFLVPMQVVNTPRVFTTVVLKNPLKSIYTSADGFCMLKIHIFTALCTAFVLQHIVPIIFLQK